MSASSPAAARPGSRLVGTGHFQPAQVVTNDDLAKRVDTNDEWIVKRVGIRERRLSETETVADMAIAAARDALTKTGIDPSDIDMVVVATCTAEERSPSVAARVIAAIGAPSATAFDINSACSGFTHALAVTDHALAAGAARHAIVIGAERMSNVTDWADRTTCVLVGDGAGAVVLEAVEEGEFSPVHWGSVPGMTEAVTIGGPTNTFAQDGREVYRWAISEAADVARAVLDKAGIDPSELAVVVPHQANLRIIEHLARQLGAENAIVAKDVVWSGNTSGATVPLALSKLLEAEDIAPGAPILVFGFGAGFSFAGQVIRAPRK